MKKKFRRDRHKIGSNFQVFNKNNTIIEVGIYMEIKVDKYFH